jgi:outer membrane protein OmpA-like peptidoglycan-associated protein
MTYAECLEQLNLFENQARDFRQQYENSGDSDGDGNPIDPAEQAHLDQIDNMINHFRQALTESGNGNGMCADPEVSESATSEESTVSEPEPVIGQSADDDMCVDESIQQPPTSDEEMCVDESLPDVPNPEDDMCVDDSPAPPQPPPQPQCGGDDVGPNEDNPVQVAPPQPGGSAFDDSNVTFNARGAMTINGRTTSESNFPGGTSGTVSIDAGQSGQVRIDVHIEGLEDNMAVNSAFTQDIGVTWDISADAQGNLTISSESPDVGGQTGASWMRLDSVNPSSGRAHVQVSPKIVGSSQTGGIDVGVGMENSAAPPFIQKTFRLNITVCNIPEPAPAPTRSPTSHRVYFEQPRQAEVSNAEERNLINWYQALSETTRQRVEAGEEEVTVAGFASTTGGEQMNRELSQSRADAVVAILRSYAGSNLRVSTRARGEFLAQTADNVEDDAERRAEISVTQTN